jgi:thiamine pyrophosphokinase
VTFTRALIFANGSIRSGKMVTRALQYAPESLIIAADGGARVAFHFGLTPHVVIGDMDSIAPDQLARCQASGASILRYPAAKNETDLELALLHAVGQGATWLRVIGAVGGRLDQTVSNVYLLALDALRGCDARMVAGSEETVLLLGKSIYIEGEAGDTVSLLPIGGTAHGVRTEGLRYPLHDEDLLFGPARGVSNVMDSSYARVQVQSGALIVIHTIGRA